jgi:hypothetical protein
MNSAARTEAKDTNQRWYHELSTTSAVIGYGMDKTYYLTNNVLHNAENSELKTDNTCEWITHARSRTPAAEVNLVKDYNAVTTRTMVYSKHRILYSAPWTTTARTPRVWCVAVIGRTCEKVLEWRCEDTVVTFYIDHWPTWYRRFRPILRNPHY